MKKITIAIEGMTCSACSNGLEKYLNKQNGIATAIVNLVMNNATIEYDEKVVKQEDIDRFVKEAGFKSLGKYKFELEEKASRKETIKIIVLSVIAIITFYISMAHMWHLPEIPFLNIMQYPFNYAIALFVLSSIALVVSFGIIKNGIKNLIHLTPNMDTLVTLGTLTSYIYSIYKSILIWQNISATNNAMNLYYESVVIVLFFVEIGKFIENKNRNKTKEVLKGLVTITPKNATIIIDDEEKEVTIDEIQKGDIVICKPGEKIAVDGEITEGETHIDESFVTGESTPVKRKSGSKVIAGSINYEGFIKYRAEKIGKESTVSEIVKLCIEATNTKPPIAKMADKVSGIFVPVIILIAIIACGVWYFISKDISVALDTFATILVVACPCSLGLATPLAIVVSTGTCIKHGILVKQSIVLENARRIKTIMFDKTGTLTKGKLSVSSIINYSMDEKEVLKDIGSLEKKSEHPIAKAIVQYAKEKGAMFVAVKDFKALIGKGIYGKIGLDEIYVGNKKLVDELNINIADDNDADSLSGKGNSVFYVVKNGELVALIGVKDVVREEAKNLIHELNGLNIQTVMITGDNEKSASVIANELGIENTIANCSPSEKSNKIKEYKKQGVVAMCGDGINDSISLINSDIGIAISNGTDISIDSASVVLMNDNISKIIDLIKISKRTVGIIKQNLFWAFLYNICMIPVACGVFKPLGIEINPVIGSIAMMVSSMIVVLNSLRLKHY